MTPIDHFSKFKPGETVIQLSLRKIDGIPFVEFTTDKLPQDQESLVFGLSIINMTLASMLAEMAGKSKEYEKVFRQITNAAGRKTTQYADEELR